MIYLTVGEILWLHEMVVAQSGGLSGIKNRGLIESAVAQPKMAFGGSDLYPTLPDKAAALGFSLAGNHGFEDGNKRIAHLAMEAMLLFNGYELAASVDAQERIMLQLAGGELNRDSLIAWVRNRMAPLPGEWGA